MYDRFHRKFNVRPCCEHQISSGNLSHDSAFDRRTLLFLPCCSCSTSWEISISALRKHMQTGKSLFSNFKTWETKFKKELDLQGRKTQLRPGKLFLWSKTGQRTSSPWCLQCLGNLTNCALLLESDNKLAKRWIKVPARYLRRLATVFLALECIFWSQIFA